MTKMMTVHCNAGHDFEILSRRGRPPKWCPKHTPVYTPQQGTHVDYSGGVPTVIPGPDPAEKCSEQYPLIQTWPNLSEDDGQRIIHHDGDPTNNDITNLELQRNIYCELGEHKFWYPVRRGKYPKNCHEHRPDKSLPSPKSSQTVSKIMQKVLESPGAASCRCGLTPETTREELRALGGGCSDPHHVCPTVDMARRMIGV
jgi:hypothetical protein